MMPVPSANLAPSIPLPPMVPPPPVAQTTHLPQMVPLPPAPSTNASGAMPPPPPMPAQSIAPVSSPSQTEEANDSFNLVRHFSMARLSEWIRSRTDKQLANSLLNASILRPLGRCGCAAAHPFIISSHISRGSDLHQILCKYCSRCHSRVALDFCGTPFVCERQRTSLQKELLLFAHWANGSSQAETAADVGVHRNFVGAMWSCFRSFARWKERSRPPLDNSDTIIDITWGPHRRVAHSGAPARPRVMSSITYQVALGYTIVDGKRRFTPSSLRTQRVLSKQATYNANVATTLMNPNCRVTTDQGGEWARMKYRYADAQSVNHSIEWITADGITTNLGECYNGILKTLGTSLCIWAGSSAASDLDSRWQELTWRINTDIHRRDVEAGARFLAGVNLLRECQIASEGNTHGNRRVPGRDIALSQIADPTEQVRIVRFPTKQTVRQRELWRMLRQWMLSPRDRDPLILPNLCRQERFFIHKWCDCWNGISHISTGEDPNRILELRREAHVTRRQIRSEEQHPDDAIEDNSGHSEMDREEEADGPSSKRPRIMKRPASRRNVMAPFGVELPVGDASDIVEVTSDEDASGSTPVADDALVLSSLQPVLRRPSQRSRSSLSGLSIERQHLSQCLLHRVNNILIGTTTFRATEAQFQTCTEMLNALSVQAGNPRRRFGNRSGNWTIDVAAKFFEEFTDCIRIEHSGSREIAAHYEEILGAIVQQSRQQRFIAYRRVPALLDTWESIDSISSESVQLSELDALAVDERKSFVIHRAHADCPLRVVCRAPADDSYEIS